MHGTMNVKIVNAEQARECHRFRNIKQKLHKTIAARWFNETCRERNIKPNYINIRINGNNIRCRYTMKTAIKTRINQEIKFLYVKKHKLNEQLYKLQFKGAKYWDKTWTHIINSIEQKLQHEMEETYNRLNKKFDELMKKQNKTKPQRNNQTQEFHSRTVNLTNITFTKEEQETLNLGLQHSIEKPMKTYWMNTITETENAIKLLDSKFQNAFRIMATKKLKQMYITENKTQITHKRHNYILNRIKHKITEDNAILAQADKGKTSVVIYKQDYD
jgi:hypothetical protein